MNNYPSDPVGQTLKEAQVATEIQGIKGILKMTEETIQKLYQRLNTVIDMSPKVQGTSDANKVPEPNLVPLAKELRRIKESISDKEKAISYLINLIEL